MKTIKIKSLSLINFKGIKSLNIDFGKETNIHGANGTGKTSIFDAFTWLLFGKDSTDRTAFELKTLDQDNNVIPKIDHEVSAVIEVDGEECELKRIFKEKWVKRRGALESEFGGNETHYFWNDVPLTQRDFSAKISNLVDESVFKLITSPTAFNSLKWQDQRQVLIDISGGVTNEDVAQGNPEFEDLLSKLTNKSMEEYQKQIAASIRKAKNDIKMIPTRIDEVQRNKPEALNFSAVEKELQDKRKQLESIENQISDKVAAQQEVLNKKQAIQKEIHRLETEIEDEKHKLKLQAKQEYQEQTSAAKEIESKILENTEKLDKSQKTLDRLNTEITEAQNEMDHFIKENTYIRERWNKRNAETFQMDEDSCKCPTCKREFESEDIEEKKKELFANFQKSKIQDLEELSARGKKNAGKIKDLEGDIKTLEERKAKGVDIIEEINDEAKELIQSLETARDNSTNIKTEQDIYSELYKGNKLIDSKVNEIAQLKEELQKEQTVNMDELKAKKAAITQEISGLNQQLQVKDQIKQADERIANLGKEENQLAQQIADYEKDQFTIDNFNKAKIDTLENLINNRFQFVNFKLFETQVNGGEVPTCKALINGVPFSDANTASKINAGVDIINTLCDHYEVSAPIFIDNRESVTELIETESQIINLVVDPSKKNLEVKSPELSEAI